MSASLKKNVIANFLGQGWSALMGIAFLPLYINKLGMEAYGLIGLYAVMQAWLTLLDMGITPVLTREMARYTAGSHTPCSIRTLLRSLEFLIIPLALLIVTTTYFLSSQIASNWVQAKILPVSVISRAIAIMGLVLALRIIEGIYRGALIGLQRQVWLNLTGAILATGRWGGAACVLIWGYPSIEVFFLWQGIMSAISVIILSAKVYVTLPKCCNLAWFSWGAISNVWHFATRMMLVSLLAILLTQIDKLLLSRILSLEQFGLYTFSSTVAGSLLVVVSPVSQAFYPRMIELVSNGDINELTNIYHRSAKLVSILVIPAALIMAFFGTDILYVWTKNHELAEKSAPLLKLLALGTMMNGFMHIPYILQLAYGWPSFVVKTNLVAIILLVPVIFWVAPRYGAIGTAWVWLVLNTGYVVIAAHFMYMRLLPKEKWSWYFYDISAPLISSGLCAAVLYATCPIGFGQIFTIGWILISYVLTMLFSYIATFVFLHFYKRNV